MILGQATPPAKDPILEQKKEDLCRALLSKATGQEVNECWFCINDYRIVVHTGRGLRPSLDRFSVMQLDDEGNVFWTGDNLTEDEAIKLVRQLLARMLREYKDGVKRLEAVLGPLGLDADYV